MRRTTVLVLFLLSAFALHAQKMAVKKVELAGEKIIVHYDLEDSNPNNEYQISLYSSKNNFATALAKVSGDVGNEVKAGANKKITWNIKEELGPYKGKLSLEVRGKVFVPVVKLNNVTVGKNFKRGKSHTITWKPGNTNAIHIELMKGGQRVTGELNQPNNGSFSLYIPAHAAIGKDYTLRITDSKNAEDAVSSVPFGVSRKIPLLLKVVPALAVGGLAAILLSGGGTPDPGPPDAGGEIPLPDKP